MTAVDVCVLANLEGARRHRCPHRAARRRVGLTRIPLRRVGEEVR